MSLSKNIVNARKAKGLRPSQLATLLGVSRSLVYNWENGGPGPRLSNLRRIATELDTTVSALLGEAA